MTTDTNTEKALKPAPAALPILDDLAAKGFSDKPFGLIVTIQIKPEQREAFIELARKTAKSTLAEPGCLIYRFEQDIMDPNCFVLIEEWKHAKALREHFQFPHTQAILAFMREHTQHPPQMRPTTPMGR